jgi:hypothetical protein
MVSEPAKQALVPELSFDFTEDPTSTGAGISVGEFAVAALGAMGADGGFDRTGLSVGDLVVAAVETLVASDHCV